MPRNRIYTERTVTVHGIEGRGATKAAARADAIEQIAWLAVAEPFTEVRFGYVLCAWPHGRGWSTAVFWPCEHGKEIYHSTILGRETRWDVVIGLRMDAAQRAWSPCCNDAALIESAGLDDWRTDTLRRWVQFQRDYLARDIA